MTSLIFSLFLAVPIAAIVFLVLSICSYTSAKKQERQQPGSVMHQKNPVKIREGIQAKQKRLAYVQKYFPELENAAKQELLMACVYALQGYRKDLEKTQRKAASREICSVIEQLDAVDVSEGAAKQKLLMKAAMKWPEPVAAVLNFLIDIHILT